MNCIIATGVLDVFVRSEVHHVIIPRNLVAEFRIVSYLSTAVYYTTRSISGIVARSGDKRKRTTEYYFKPYLQNVRSNSCTMINMYRDAKSKGRKLIIIWLGYGR